MQATSLPGLGNSNLNYFVALDANASAPQMFLSGDDNLLIGGEAGRYGVAIKGVPVKPGLLSLWTNTPVGGLRNDYQKQGNVGLADGSVQGVQQQQTGGRTSQHRRGHESVVVSLINATESSHEPES
ncbi:MAG: hypothetical protein U1F83_10225 [Verrucomicrobiota bacterium]